MPASSPRAAVADFLAPLRRVAACLTERPLIADGYRPALLHTVSFVPLGRAAPLRVRPGAPRLMLWLKYDYVVVVEVATEQSDHFRIRLNGYRCHILDRQEREVLAYHWHPTGPSHVTDPHLHLSSRVGTFRPELAADPVALAEMHLSTGYVSLADIARLLIAEFGIEPRRPDWQTVLQQSPPVP